MTRESLTFRPRPRKHPMRPEINCYEESAEFIKNRIREKFGDVKIEWGIILGSGLGDFADGVDGVVIPYSEIPHFPVSTVDYQKGELSAGCVEGKFVLCMNGRFHFYEGYEMWETAYPIGVFKRLGVDRMIITNAAGGIGYADPDVEPMKRGELVIVTDHIKFAQDSPSRGKSVFGNRFFDMQSVYDKDLRALAHKTAEKLGFRLREGVYAYMTGPQYETPAEIRALRLMGANLVGMSTVPEVISAAELGIRVLCVSCVTNLAAGVTGEAITSEEVIETTKRVHDRFDALLHGLISNPCNPL